MRPSEWEMVRTPQLPAPHLNGTQSRLKHLLRAQVPNTNLGFGDTVIILNMTDKVATFSGLIFQSGETDTKHINKQQFNSDE